MSGVRRNLPAVRQHSESGPRSAAARAWQRAMRWGSSWCAVLVSVSCGLVAIAFAAPKNQEFLALGWLLLSLTVSVSLVWRRRMPVVVCLSAAGLSLVAPLDPFAALLAWSWVLTLRRGLLAWLCGFTTSLTVAAALTRDYLRPPRHTLFAFTEPDSGEHISAPGPAYLVVGLVAVLSFWAWGMVRRSRRETRVAMATELERAKEASHLRNELSSQEERQLIAREVHDTVAHQLSLVALQASALEVGDRDPQAARNIRGAAQNALDEVRALLGWLRDGESPATQTGSLADLPQLIEDARGSGAQVISSIYVEDVASTPAPLSRAIYRIVQECLTNALRHAPGEVVMVEIAGPAHDAFRIEVRNRVCDPVREQLLGSGSGRAGMIERARSLGGSLTASRSGEEFVVSAHLPRQSEHAPAGPPSTRTGPAVTSRSVEVGGGQ